MSEITATVELLISTIASENLDQISAFKILDEHVDCFSADLCAICSYLEEESLGDVLLLMARNPSITKDVQKRILDESFKWQGAEIGVMLSLARNPALDSEIRPSLLHAEIWYGFGYGHELISDLIEAAAGNPNFPEDEIDLFEDECAEDYDYPK
jgi:hypothetical protein